MHFSQIVFSKSADFKNMMISQKLLNKLTSFCLLIKTVIKPNFFYETH